MIQLDAIYKFLGKCEGQPDDSIVSIGAVNRLFILTLYHDKTCDVIESCEDLPLGVVEPFAVTLFALRDSYKNAVNLLRDREDFENG